MNDFNFLDIVIQDVKEDYFLSKHTNYFIKEMRIRVYSQFLHSFKSVTIGNMANSFGLSETFIDSYLYLLKI